MVKRASGALTEYPNMDGRSGPQDGKGLPARRRISDGIIGLIMPVGIYISVPFCRTKCSYCNFASDVFSRAVFERYVDRVCADI